MFQWRLGGGPEAVFQWRLAVHTHVLIVHTHQWPVARCLPAPPGVVAMEEPLSLQLAS